MTSRLSDVVTYGGAQLPAPKFATQRNYDRPTIGGLRQDFSTIWLGAPLMPWQCWVSDVAGELDPDTGLPWYDLVVVTLQRQAGKSHLSMTKTCERCVSVPKWRAWYTAQTGGDARDQFLKFDEDNLDGQPLRSLIKTLRGNGHEAMKFPNGSQLRPHPPTEKALHGKQSDENDIDEAWAFSTVEGRALMQAISPTQLTRPAAQTWVWSAGGTAASTWLAQLVADGRAGAPAVQLPDQDRPSRIAYFEWGIPDDLPLDDLEAIASYHPAIGHTMTIESLRKLRTQLPDDADFARAAGNRWTEIIGGAISADLWTASRFHAEIPAEAPVAFGAARAADGSEVGLVAAAFVDDQVVVEVLEVMTSPYHAPAQIKTWVDGAPVAVLPAGPSAALAKQLAREKVKLHPMTQGDGAAAVATFLDGLRAGTIKARPNADLDAQVKIAGTRSVGDGGTAWAQIGQGSIALVVAATNAVLALADKPVTKPKPKVWVPGSQAS